MRTIDTKEHFVQEYKSLLADIDRNISDLGKYQRTQMDGPTVELTNRLNSLKLHRKKVEDMLMLYSDVSEEEWVEIRPSAQDIFGAAYEAWQKASDTVADA